MPSCIANFFGHILENGGTDKDMQWSILTFCSIALDKENKWVVILYDRDVSVRIYRRESIPLPQNSSQSPLSSLVLSHPKAKTG